jgi:HD superfamily phosphohydrolase
MVKQYKRQRIRDPLYNLIEFKANEIDNLIWDVIQTSEFQRLRRIRQLGFSEFVYPGATHTRFSHSLGVFYIARRLIEIIDGKLTGSSSANSKHSKKEAALFAALLHDIGHGPFSHAFEDVGKRLDLKALNHEVITDKLVRNSGITDVLKILRNGFDIEVANAIAEHNDIYSAVVSGQFDADRLDYMQRDRLMTGTYLGTVDLEWLLSNLEIGTVNFGAENKKSFDVETFVINAKGIYAVEAYALNLFQLYPTIYFHKTTRCAEKLFTELMVMAIENIKANGCNFVNLSESHPFVKFANDPDNIDNIISLDDTVVWGALEQLKNTKVNNINKLAKRLSDRNLFKCIDVDLKQILLDKRPKDRNLEEDKALKAAFVDINEKVKEWNAKHNDIDDWILFDFVERSPYNPSGENKKASDQIWVKKSNNDIDMLINQSDIVKGMQPFLSLRAYVAKKDNAADKYLQDIVRNYSY